MNGGETGRAEAEDARGLRSKDGQNTSAAADIQDYLSRKPRSGLKVERMTLLQCPRCALSRKSATLVSMAFRYACILTESWSIVILGHATAV